MVRRCRQWLLGTLCVFTLAACSEPGGEGEAAKAVEWKLVTSWPKGFPGMGVAPERFADTVNRLSNGRLVIRVYGAGELVPSFDVFNAVSKGTVQMGHSAAFYWQEKIPAAPFFSSVPFGLSAQEMNAWLHYGGGLALWQSLYEPYGVVPMAGGNTGAQMGGWFNKEIQTMDDLKGLKMRLPGYGADVFKRAGGIPVSLSGGELFTALETGAIDAAEWVGPYNDLAFGLHNAAKYYYYPGWQEPSTTLEFLVNQQALQSLPDDLQQLVITAARAVNQDLLDEYTVKNMQALDVLVREHDVALRRFPAPVLVELQRLTRELLVEISENDPVLARIYASYRQFQADTQLYNRVSSGEIVNGD
ncbi:TRAP transporter substrate-binding protein [Photobacterium sp. TY1-4]|uniref:TRAP transporter substrate-binding protein n=1 Tax=Photobacterium sp. TY1-4 TaxID=2899122 RepID=UPI0021C0B61E|nr:TRAP transporter substrate-binding protein [Photobacterium sp. TY1-4]UXI00659.1 TRAP transporter substrate-binding protein [Photobacterium sp. TY1-4]